MSSIASWNLEKQMHQLDEECTEDNNSLSEERSSKLNQAMQELRLTVIAEAQEVTAFFRSEKRLSAGDLFDHPDKIFG